MSVMVKKPKISRECKVVINRTNCWPPCPSVPLCTSSPCQQVKCGSCPTTALVRFCKVQGGVTWCGLASVPCVPMQPSCCPSPSICYYYPSYC